MQRCENLQLPRENYQELVLQADQKYPRNIPRHCHQAVVMAVSAGYSPFIPVIGKLAPLKDFRAKNKGMISSVIVDHL
jgi:hypothetical protein